MIKGGAVLDTCTTVLGRAQRTCDGPDWGGLGQAGVADLVRGNRGCRSIGKKASCKPSPA